MPLGCTPPTRRILIGSIAIVAATGLIAAESRRTTFADVPAAIRPLLGEAGRDEQRFAAYLSAVDVETGRRVADGDREHLVYYALQSSAFTRRPRIEPALSARRFVDRLPAAERERLLADAAFRPAAGLPSDERARFADLLRAVAKPAADPRLASFVELLQSLGPPASPDALYGDYVGVARFLYLKEFVAARDAADVARLYQARPHSSDTQIEASFGVAVGLGVIRALDNTFRATRVLVVGPGLDLAPRTDLVDAVPPQSTQPLAIADAVLSLGFATASTLRVHAVDVNPRVVRAVEGLAREGEVWHVFAGVPERPGRPLAPDYREYAKRLGEAIGRRVEAPAGLASTPQYLHSVRLGTPVAGVFSAERLNVITERVAGQPFDVIVATNVLPYFDDRQLALAVTNIAAMLAPGGYFLHNESRAVLVAAAAAAGIPAIQQRSVILGGPKDQPLYDIVSIHQRR